MLKEPLSDSFGEKQRHWSMALGALLSAAILLSLTGCASGPSMAASPVSDREALGQQGYEWDPQASPSGPVDVRINLNSQMLYVYRNGLEIGRAKISSGKPGHDTPTGNFTILQKNRTHRSSEWGSYIRNGAVIGDGNKNSTPAGASFRGASMPYMMRLTWSGVAMHTGHVPDRPASHGCIRLPNGFAPKLFAVTKIGTPVQITGVRRATLARSYLTNEKGLRSQKLL